MWQAKGPNGVVVGVTMLKNAYQRFVFGGVETYYSGCPRTCPVAEDDLERLIISPPLCMCWDCRNAGNYMQFNKYKTLSKSLNHSSARP